MRQEVPTGPLGGVKGVGSELEVPRGMQQISVYESRRSGRDTVDIGLGSWRYGDPSWGTPRRWGGSDWIHVKRLRRSGPGQI